MSPKEYVENYRFSGPLQSVLTPHQRHDAQDILDAGYRFISSKISEEYGDDMTPSAVQAVELLTIMLGVFVEHASNPGLLKRAIG